MWAGQGWTLPLEKRAHFFLSPWLLVCEFIEISNTILSFIRKTEFSLLKGATVVIFAYFWKIKLFLFFYEIFLKTIWLVMMYGNRPHRKLEILQSPVSHLTPYHICLIDGSVFPSRINRVMHSESLWWIETFQVIQI